MKSSSRLAGPDRLNRDPDFGTGNERSTHELQVATVGRRCKLKFSLLRTEKVMGTRKLFTAALATLVLVGWGVVAAPPVQQPDKPAANAGQNAGLQLIYPDLCFIMWADERTISAKIPGRIAKRFVKDGDRVEPGKELARLDDREAQVEFDVQKILGDSDLDELVQYEKYVEYLARKDAADRLVNPRAISIEEWRLAQVNVKVNEYMTRKEAEKHKVEKLKADRAKIFLDEHYVTSPIKGIVRTCFKRENESVAAGELQLFHIVATDRVWVEGVVSTRDMYRVKTGQAVTVRLKFDGPDMPELQVQSRKPLKEEMIEFYGSVIFIDPQVDRGNQFFKVKAEVENQHDPVTKDPILRAGLRAAMSIVTNEAAEEKAKEKQE